MFAFYLIIIVLIVAWMIYSVYISIKANKMSSSKDEKQSKNPSFHRTEREEELSFQFEMNHSDEIDKRIKSFEECYELACDEDNLNKKIELLEKTIVKFEKARSWFYRTKGGTIYFQDMYEHLHNSKNDDFSYIDEVKECLEECIEEKDQLIPEILDFIDSNSDGRFENDLYNYIHCATKHEIQQIIKELENDGLIEREKCGNTYILTIKQNIN